MILIVGPFSVGLDSSFLHPMIKKVSIRNVVASLIFFTKIYNNNDLLKLKTHSLSGFLISGPLGPYFELF